MDKLLPSAKLIELLEFLQQWVQDSVLLMSNLAQIGIVAVLFGVAWLLSGPTRRLIAQLRERRTGRLFLGFWQVAALVAFPAIWLLLQWLALVIATKAGWPHHLLTITVSLLTAWVIIRVASSFLRDQLWSKFISIIAWTIAALNILGLLDETIALLDGTAFKLGAVTISLLSIVKAVLALAVLLWIASILSRVFEQRIRSSPNLTPSVQVLFSKLLKVTLLAVAFVAAISSVGIDLTAFAVLGGAIGVGIGFGLQKIVANLISGVILLLDKSIKPGDVIAVAEYYGWVNSLGARYVSVITRDGIEHLIPNEELIINRVENWSYSDRNIRLRIPVGVHYKSDVRKAMQLCLEAAADVERVLEQPKTACLLKGFGDSSVDLEIRIWINDPANGRSNVMSQVLLGVWDRFHEHGIEIPYPQRDLHVRTPEDLAATLREARSNAAA